MGNKIIIDEEVLAKLDELINESENDFDKSLQNGERSKMHYAAARNSSYKKAKLLILENSTTISIDESIDDRAKKLINELNDYATMVDCYDYGLPIYDEHKLNLINIIKSFATEQSIISEIKSKEKEPNKCTKD
jgi:hypothetical protein